jgi:type II secretory pathway component PulL
MYLVWRLFILLIILFLVFLIERLLTGGNDE